MKKYSGACPPRAAPADHGAGRVMLIDLDRVHYAGLLGAPAARTLGALALYVSFRSPLRIRTCATGWETTEMAVVPPYTPHGVASDDRLIFCSLIEPESVDPARLPRFLDPARVHFGSAAAARRLRRAYTLVQAARPDAGAHALDPEFFGAPLPGRRLDPRIGAVVDDIKRHPCRRLSAEAAAAAAGLSVSRFLHLFRAEVGAPFRAFQAWKRARNLLRYVTQASTLTHIALEAGYPDATHFSHAVRQVYGLTPRDIFAGSRRLAVYAGVDEPAAAPLAQTAGARSQFAQDSVSGAG